MREPRFGCPRNASFASLPGCFDNPAELVQTAGELRIAQPFTLVFRADTSLPGAAIVFLGVDSTDPFGCGQFLSGLGELMLLPSPLIRGPIKLSVEGQATYPKQIPNSPSLVGLTLAYQGYHVTLGQNAQFELSNSLRGTIVP